jgi:hypothetical protein
MSSSAASIIDLRTHRRDVTSQHGENGILAAIFERIGTTSRRCVEFGAYSLTDDSNVFLLWRDAGWDALLIEGDPGRAAAIQRAYAEMKASSQPPLGHVTVLNTFVRPTGEQSLDVLLAAMEWDKDLDLCVIDVDGMDYHIFEHLTKTRPRVVVCEFNPTIPVHLSVVGSADGNYLGCSARALFELGRRKGYSLVACTKSNCIFLLDELADGFQNCNDLDLLFDDYAVSHFMTAYDGSVFLSKPPLYRGNLFSSRAASDLYDPTGNLWSPHRHLTISYAVTRLAFSVVNALAPWLAAAALRTLRAIRRRTGRTFLAPPRESP